MMCPRCGEKMYGSVCPRCGNIVVDNSRNSTRIPNRNVNRAYTREQDNIKFMDSGTRSVRPSAKKSSVDTKLYKIAVVVLAVLCVFLFFRYNGVKSDFEQAQTTINTQNETIKARDAEIAELKTANAAATGDDKTNEESNEDSDTPSVEFDENGNLVNITDNGGSSDNSQDSDNKSEYKSGDTYVVKDGDVGSSICQEIYGKYTPELWEKLLAANGLTTSSNYHPGDEFIIP